MKHDESSKSTEKHSHYFPLPLQGFSGGSRQRAFPSALQLCTLLQKETHSFYFTLCNIKSLHKRFTNSTSVHAFISFSINKRVGVNSRNVLRLFAINVMLRRLQNSADLLTHLCKPLYHSKSYAMSHCDCTTIHTHTSVKPFSVWISLVSNTFLHYFSEIEISHPRQQEEIT